MRDYQLVSNPFIKHSNKLNSTYYINQLDKLLPTEMCKFYLGYILYYINNIKDKLTVTSQDIAQSSAGLFNAKRIGDTLRFFPIESEITSRYKSKNNRPNITKWKIKEIRNVCATYYIHPLNLEELNTAINGKTSTITSKIVQKTPIIDNSGVIGANPSEQNTIPYSESVLPFILPSFHTDEITIIADIWNINWGYSFYFSYSIMRKLLEESIPTITSKKLWLNDKLNGKCLEFNHNPDANNYPMLNESLITRIFNGMPKELLNVSHFPATSLTRLMGMVLYPYFDWGIVKQNEPRAYVAHHLCFNPACISPAHLRPMTEEQHNFLHKKINDNHPINNPLSEIQVLKKEEELVVH